MNDLSPELARHVIDTVGGSGTPPISGFEYFTAGLTPYLNVIEKEYVSSYIRNGGSAFKMVVGIYGGGKTHFLYSVRDIGWKHGFVVSYVSLSPGSSPFHQLELVYKAIVGGILPSLTSKELLGGYEKGIVPFIRRWYADRFRKYQQKGFVDSELHEAMLSEIEEIQGIESLSFGNACKHAFRSLLQKNDDSFTNICQWLQGEGFEKAIHKNYGILQKIDKTTAFKMIRSLVQWLRQIGHSGLIILLDEAEKVPSLTTKQRELHLNNLREIIDACGNTNFLGTMIFYAVPDEAFLEGKTQVYEALKQRVATYFELPNPTGVKIMLEHTVVEPLSFLKEVGNRLSSVYEVAYGFTFDREKIQEVIDRVANGAYEKKFGDIGYKRLFMQDLIREFNSIRFETST